jgi:uncharacterized C2H2 Zn-finger protein
MEINPWNVESIDTFSYFKCPECSFLSQVKKYFEDHAVKNHHLSAVLFDKAIENLKVIIIQVGSIRKSAPALTF